jgi:hypothetical protein
MKSKNIPLPPNYPRFVDRAAPLLILSSLLEPDLEIVKIEGKTDQTITKGARKTRKKTSSGIIVTNKTTAYHSPGIEWSGLDKKGNKVDQVLTLKEVAASIADIDVPEMVIDLEVVQRKAPNDCPVCDKYGLENILSFGKSKQGASKGWFVAAQSPAKFMISRVPECNIDYPVIRIGKHLRSVHITENIAGVTGGKVLPWYKFLDAKYGHGTMERIQLPWLNKKFYNDLFYPTVGCGSVYEQKSDGGFYGASPGETA